MQMISQYLPTVIAALVVTAILVALLFGFKRFSRRPRGRQGQRLGITEYHVVDEQRRLVLVRRDNVEHLLLIGGQQDLLIEAQIPQRSANVEEPRSVRAEPPPTPVRPAPRAPVFADRRPNLRPVEPAIISPMRNFPQDED